MGKGKPDYSLGMNGLPAVLRLNTNTKEIPKNKLLGRSKKAKSKQVWLNRVWERKT